MVHQRKQTDACHCYHSLRIGVVAGRIFSAFVAVQVGLVFNPQFTKDKSAALLKRLDGDGDGKVDIDEWLSFFGLLLPTLPSATAAAGIALLLARSK